MTVATAPPLPCKNKKNRRAPLPKCRPDGPRKFVILSQARSGSTYLSDMLNSHPEVCAGEELLNPEREAVSCRFEYRRVSLDVERTALV